MARKLRAIELDIWHNGCFGCNVTELFPEVEMKTLSVILIKKDSKLKGYKLLVSIEAPDPAELQSFLDSLKTNKRVKELHVWGKAGKRAFAFMKIDTQTSSYEEVLKQGAMHFDHVVMAKGVDSHPIVTSDWKSLKGMLNEMHEIGEIKVKKIGSISPKINDALLTEKQLDALHKALSFDYYSWPRKVDLAFLAKKSELSRRAYQEHLRKAESKILPELLKSYLLTKKAS